MVRRPLLFVAVFAIFVVLIPRPAHAQSPKRPQRCSPYPKLAQKISNMTPVPEKQYVLDEVHFDGDTKLSSADLENVAESLKQHSPFSKPDWYETVSAMARRTWQDRGYFREEISASAEILSHDPTAEHYAVILHVNAGRLYRTGDVRLESLQGHMVFPLDELRKLVPLEKGDLFATDKLREAFDAIHRRFGEAGYIDFTIVPEFGIDEDKGVVNLTLTLDESKQFRVAKVEVLGVDPITESSLRSATPVGEPFNYRRVLEAIDENRSKLPEDAGVCDIQLLRDNKNGTISITFNFQSCPQLKN